MKLITLKKNKTELEFNKFNQIKNKILILRESGGYGDILNMRMIFEDLKNKYPEFEFVGPVPMDFDTKLGFGQCVVDELCKVKLENLIAKGDTKLGPAFCKKYGQINYVLSILSNKRAREHIKTFFVK